MNGGDEWLQGAYVINHSLADDPTALRVAVVAQRLGKGYQSPLHLTAWT